MKIKDVYKVDDIVTECPALGTGRIIIVTQQSLTVKYQYCRVKYTHIYMPDFVKKLTHVRP